MVLFWNKLKNLIPPSNKAYHTQTKINNVSEIEEMNDLLMQSYTDYFENEKNDWKN